MPITNSTDVITRCTDLQRFWKPRNNKMKSWYKLIQMVDQLKTEGMESFVGNDPRAMYNLILHMLDTNIPHRLANLETLDPAILAASSSVTDFFEVAWRDVKKNFRLSGPHQSMMRHAIGLLLATGWYSWFAIISDDGTKAVVDVWNPAEVYPLWNSEFGLSECAHVTTVSEGFAKSLANRNGWDIGRKIKGPVPLYDYWWIDVGDAFPFTWVVSEAVVLNGKLVKNGLTRFKKIPIYTGPVGGLPDTGALSEGVQLSTAAQDVSAWGGRGERWKEEIGQSIVATNENIYKTWNKWWTFSMQILRDTAQPKIFERSRSGKKIVEPQDVFRRGTIFRGGPDDSIEYLATPPMPIELRTTQLDLEAMMQRGGPSWSMYGNIQGSVTAYVMSQMSASAGQVARPFHEAIINVVSDIDNDFLQDIMERGVTPYGWQLPPNLPADVELTAKYEIEIPGELVQKATVARMLDPDFALSYSYTLNKLFPDIKDPMRETARRLSDMAALNPVNSIIAQVTFYRRQAAYLESINQPEVAKLYNMAVEAAVAQLGGSTPSEEAGPAGRIPMGSRTEGMPAPTQALPPGGG